MIRPALKSDIPWLMEVALHAYPQGTYNEDAGIHYWTSIIENPNCLLLRGEKAVMGFMVMALPYLPEFKIGITLPIASTGNAGGELLEMTRRGLEWAKTMGADHVDFAAVNGTDLGPLARRFGGKAISPAYRVEFNHV